MVLSVVVNELLVFSFGSVPTVGVSTTAAVAVGTVNKHCARKDGF
jgi:hypothetical protein